MRRRWERGALAWLSIFVLVLAAACDAGGSGSTHAASTTTRPPPALPAGAACGAPDAPPEQYASVVVFSFENRTWDEVGPGFGPEMPYLHGLGQQCAWFPGWTEAAVEQNSLSQYVGQITGAPQPGTVNDCKPSASCSTKADNLFRQLRRAGRRAVDYVEGATKPCSDAGNAAKHIPALYLWGADDRAHCKQQVRPFREFDAKHLPAFAFVTPTLCNDGHDCGNDVVDAWAKAHIQPVLDSAAYRAGRVAVFVWYDEDQPVPNLWITPTAVAGPRTDVAGGFAGTLRAWQAMLGVRCLKDACTAPDLRQSARS